MKYLLMSVLVVAVTIGILLGVFIMSDNNAYPVSNNTQPQTQAIFANGKFFNNDTSVVQDMSKIGAILWRYMTEKRIDPTPSNAIPIETITSAELALDDDTLIYRLGHSSVLLNFEGEIWLTDPVFSKRASPIQWAGPERFHPVPLDIDTLPAIQGIVISHNHYDHLDYDTIQRLRPKVGQFIVPMGVKQTLVKWGVAESKIAELNWWESVTVGKVSLTATPAQHFSGRGLTDTDESLWASWVFQTDKAKVFFSGDSGYFDGFKQIGDAFGPFDITLMETGAYDKNWADIHMHPEQTLQAHMDLGGKALIPVHNSTFDLAMHPWYEPLEQLVTLAQHPKQAIITPIIGQAVSVKQVQQSDDVALLKHSGNNLWWRTMMPHLQTLQAAQNNIKEASGEVSVQQVAAQ